MPINKLLITMSLPMIISMLVQALYNVVDSIFVSQISENALTAVSLAFHYKKFYDSSWLWNWCRYKCIAFKIFR